MIYTFRSIVKTLFTRAAKATALFTHFSKKGIKPTQELGIIFGYPTPSRKLPN